VDHCELRDAALAFFGSRMVMDPELAAKGLTRLTSFRGGSASITSPSTATSGTWKPLAAPS